MKTKVELHDGVVNIILTPQNELEKTIIEQMGEGRDKWDSELKFLSEREMYSPQTKKNHRIEMKLTKTK